MFVLYKQKKEKVSNFILSKQCFDLLIMYKLEISQVELLQENKQGRRLYELCFMTER